MSLDLLICEHKMIGRIAYFTQNWLSCFCRLEILVCQELNAIHLYPVACVEPFRGWHQSYWMAATIGSLKRWGFIFSFFRIIIIEANISVEAYMVITSFKLSFLCLGWCLLIWYGNVGNHHRRRAICQHALWCYHRYNSHLVIQTISNFSGSILSSNLLKRFHAGIDYVSLI